MHSGRNTGWSGELDWPPAQAPGPGKHRRSTTTESWTPAPGWKTVLPQAGVPQSAGAPSGLPQSGADPLADTIPVGGLHKFDLGMVPASVTPPRTWRRAAWFAVASSAAVACGLVYGTVTLVNYADPGRYPPGSPMRLGQQPRAVFPGSLEDPFGQRTGVARPTGLVGERLSSTAAPTAGPTAAPLSDTNAIRDRAEQYFSLIRSSDPGAAFALTTGRLRAEGFARFASRYPRAVQVVDVRVAVSSAVATLRTTTDAGDVRIYRRELRFTTGRDPLITADERIA